MKSDFPVEVGKAETVKMDDGQPPRFIVPLEDETKPIGVPMELLCKVTGVPMPQVSF